MLHQHVFDFNSLTLLPVRRRLLRHGSPLQTSHMSDAPRPSGTPPRRALANATRRRPPWWQRLRWDRLAVVAVPPILFSVVLVALISDDSSTVTASTAPATTTSTTTTWRPASTRCVATSGFDTHTKLAQLVMVAYNSAPAESVTALLARVDPPGGLLFTGAAQPALTSGVIRDLTAASPALVAVDDEGGRVDRLGKNGPPLVSARRLGSTATPAEILQLTTARSVALRGLGVTINFAPVVDLSSEPDKGPIGDRSFSTDPTVVTNDAGAFAAGMRAGGVLPTLKHYPGHGRASGDSHDAAVTTPPIGSLRAGDLVPYRTILDQGEAAVMVGHLDVPGLTEPGVPASLSPATYQMLRTVDQFNGLAITDELGAMTAVAGRFELPEAAMRAIIAGADMVIISPSTAFDAVVSRLDAAAGSGELPAARIDEAFGRVRQAQGCTS